MSRRDLFRWCGGRRCFWKVLLFTLWPLTLSMAQPGKLMHANTLANNSKSNQSRIWFYDGKWWAIAPHAQSNADYIWRHNAAVDTWIRTAAKLDSGALNRYDVILDVAAGDLAILRSHNTNTTFYRFTYNAGVWSLNTASLLASFSNADNNNPCSLIKAKNGDFWVFRIDGSRLQARRSGNGGTNWSGIINLKLG